MYPAAATQLETDVTFKIEPYFDVWPEFLPLIEQHYDEIALNKDHAKLAPCWDRYATLAKEGTLHVVTARETGGKLVGYIVSMVMPHLHYREMLTAYVDIFYMRRDERAGLNGIRMFRFFEKEMRHRGVKLLFSGTKLKLNLTRMFEFLEWKQSDILFQKVLD